MRERLAPGVHLLFPTENTGWTEVTVDAKGHARLYRPLRWGSVVEYVQWLIDNFEQTFVAQLASEPTAQERQEVLDFLRYLKSRLAEQFPGEAEQTSAKPEAASP